MPNFINKIYIQLKKQRVSGYLRKLVKAYVDPEDVEVFLCGRQINPATKNFIASATEEVLFQFYIYECGSHADLDVIDALIKLNEKPSKNKIQIKFLIDRRIGPAQWLTEDSPWHLWRFHRHHEKKHTYSVCDRKGNWHVLDNLEIKVENHAHYTFNSYHTKQIIVDRKRLMLRSGDICSDSDSTPDSEGWTQTATSIENQHLAHEAAISFLARFNGRISEIKKQFHDFANIPDANILLFEKSSSYDPLKCLFYNSPYKLALIAGIPQAQQSIKIMTSNLNDKDVLKALADAVKRGVSVFIVTGKYQFQEWERYMGGTNLDSVRFLYRSIPVEKWDLLHIRWACDSKSTEDNKCLIFDNNKSEMMHGKVAVIDDELCFAGSSPIIDVQTAKFSAESDAVIESAEIAQKYLDKAFNLIFNRGLATNDVRLEVIKTSLINDIKRQIKVEDIHFFRQMNYDTLTANKNLALTELLSNIQNAENFITLNAVFKPYLVVDQTNVLAKHRRHLSFFQKDFGNTKTVQQLTTIYNLHFIEQLRLKEGDPDYKARAALL